MSSETQQEELEASIAAAELTDEEADEVRGLVADGGIPTSAIEHVLEQREPEVLEVPPASAQEQENGEPDPKRLRALERAIGDHLDRVREVMGPFVAGFDPCGVCGGVGLMPPEPEVRENPNFRACPTCNGYGVVKTGARNEAHFTRACPDCAGRGYQERLDPSGAPIVAAPGAAPATAPAPTPAPLEPSGDGNGAEPDAPRFGTPSWMGDPNLGQ